MRPPFTTLAISPGTAGPGAYGGDGWPAWLEALAGAGVDAVQLREKSLSDLELYRLARRARRALPPAVRVVVNGRFDVALAAGCDGVHLTSTALPTAEVRRRLGPEHLIGRSTHTVDEVERAARDGADYVVYGPVWPTPGKEALGAPRGGAGLAAAAAVGLPVYALGGVTIDRLGESARCGAAGIAAIRLFQAPAERLAEIVAAARAAFPTPDR